MNKRVIWIIELILWTIVAISLSFLLVFINSAKQQQLNSYYLFFSDIDGLMKGSPVRLMGMQIGYVQDIKVFDSKVFVSFLVTDKNVKVPEQATATVEFYGLGGSKSLEINPSTADNSTKEDIIITKEPYRIQDFYDIQNNMARTLVRITNSFTSVVNENDIYKKRQELKFSTKVKKINTQMNDIQNEQMNLIRRTKNINGNHKFEVNFKTNQEDNNASAAN